MTGTQLLAFVVLPLALAAAGWIVVLVSEHLAQRRHLHPGE